MLTNKNCCSQYLQSGMQCIRDPETAVDRREKDTKEAEPRGSKDYQTGADMKSAQWAIKTFSYRNVHQSTCTLTHTFTRSPGLPTTTHPRSPTMFIHSASLAMVKVFIPAYIPITVQHAGRGLRLSLRIIGRRVVVCGTDVTQPTTTIVKKQTADASPDCSFKQANAAKLSFGKYVANRAMHVPCE